MDLGFNVSAYASNNDAQAALTTGKVDAWVIDDLTAGEMVAKYNSENSDKLVILNKSETAADSRADLVIHDPIGEVLGECLNIAE